MLEELTHWGRVTHICVSELTIIGSDNGLSPGRRQANIWNNAGLLTIEPLGPDFSEISIESQKFLFKKIHLNMSSAKWRPFCLGLNVLKNKRWTWHQGSGTPCMLIRYHLNYQETDTAQIFATISQHITLYYCFFFISLVLWNKRIDIHALRKNAINFAQGCITVEHLIRWCGPGCIRCQDISCHGMDIVWINEPLPRTTNSFNYTISEIIWNMNMIFYFPVTIQNLNVTG